MGLCTLWDYTLSRKPPDGCRLIPLLLPGMSEAPRLVLLGAQLDAELFQPLHGRHVRFLGAACTIVGRHRAMACVSREGEMGGYARVRQRHMGPRGCVAAPMPHLAQRFLFNLERDDGPVQILNGLWLTLLLETQARRGLVDQVDGLANPRYRPQSTTNQRHDLEVSLSPPPPPNCRPFNARSRLPCRARTDP